MNLAKLISRNVKALRERTGLSQQQLAQKAGVTARYISHVENEAPNVTVDVVEKLATGLNVSTAEILRDGAVTAPPTVVTHLNEAIRLLKSLRSHLLQEDQEPGVTT